MANEEMTEAFLAHYGVRGMRWGKRGAGGSSSTSSSSNDGKGSIKAKPKPKKELTDEEKKDRKDLIVAGSLIGVGAAIQLGARWAVNNPDKIAIMTQRAANTIKGTKAIGIGYDVVQLGLKNGRWG